MTGELLTVLIKSLASGAFVGAAIAAFTAVVARRGSLVFPLLPALLTALSAAMVVGGLVEEDSTISFMGAMLVLFFVYPLIWRASSTALRISYSVLLIAVPVLFIAIVGIGMILRLAGILALVGIAGGIANIVMLAKH